MFSDELNDLLSLFVAMILADKRVFAKEVETFLKGAKELQEIRQSHERVSEAKLLIWFENHSAEIRKKMRTPEFETWFYSILECLNGIEDKQAVIKIMFDIAQADEDFHISEGALLVLTMSHWDVQPQP